MSRKIHKHTYLTLKKRWAIFSYDPVWFLQDYTGPYSPKPGGKHLKIFVLFYFPKSFFFFFKNHEAL